MQQSISKFRRYAAPAVCALALGACFHPAQQEAAAPSGRYGGTVVAYPVGGYGFDPYPGYYGYGYDPYPGYYGYGYAPYGYGYPGYTYVRPRVVVRPPVYLHGQTGSGSIGSPRQGQYGLHPWNGAPRTGQLRPPVAGTPLTPPPRHGSGRVAQPRPVTPPAPRPTVIQKPSVPRARTAAPRPAPHREQRPADRPERRH